MSPEFIYLNPDSSLYTRINYDTINIQVIQGSKKKKRREISNKNIASNQKEIKHIKPITKLGGPKTAIMSTAWYWSLYLAPFLGLLFAGFKKRQQLLEDSIDPLTKKKKGANQEALKRLSSAKEFLDKKDFRAFYDDTTKCLLGYVSDKLNIPSSDLSKENIHSALIENNIARELAADFTEVLRKCEFGLFSGMNNGENAINIYNDSLELIGRLEELL